MRCRTGPVGLPLSKQWCPSQDARETGTAGDSGDGGGAWKQVTGGQEVEMNLRSEYVCDRERERGREKENDASMMTASACQSSPAGQEMVLRPAPGRRSPLFV